MNKTKNSNCNDSKTTIRERMTGDKVHKDFFSLRMSISFHFVFTKDPNLESAKNKSCSLTITGTSDKIDHHHLQNPSQ